MMKLSWSYCPGSKELTAGEWKIPAPEGKVYSLFFKDKLVCQTHTMYGCMAYAHKETFDHNLF